MDTLESILTTHIPNEKLNFVWSLLYGSPRPGTLKFSDSVEKKAKILDFDLQGYSFITTGCPTVDRQDAEVKAVQFVRVAVFQNSIVEPTSSPIRDQKEAILRLGHDALKTAAACGVNIFCFQEIWNMPVVFCTHKKLPWVEFAENVYTGITTTFLKKVAKDLNMVIISPVLERDENDQLWNTAVVINNDGEVLGISRKNHIPTSGKFSEAYYYTASTLGHPVFQTNYGRIAVAICYDRHFPKCWAMYAIHGAEIVFNPSATVKSFSESLWPIEARDAAVQNGFYTCAINRVGTESFQIQNNAKEEYDTVGPFYGSSYITSPGGSRTPGLSCEKNGLLIADLDLKKCTNHFQSEASQSEA